MLYFYSKYVLDFVIYKLSVGFYDTKMYVFWKLFFLQIHPWFSLWNIISLILWYLDESIVLYICITTTFLVLLIVDYLLHFMIPWRKHFKQILYFICYTKTFLILSILESIRFHYIITDAFWRNFIFPLHFKYTIDLFNYR